MATENNGQPLSITRRKQWIAVGILGLMMSGQAQGQTIDTSVRGHEALVLRDLRSVDVSALGLDNGRCKADWRDLQRVIEARFRRYDIGIGTGVPYFLIYTALQHTDGQSCFAHVEAGLHAARFDELGGTTERFPRRFSGNSHAVQSSVSEFSRSLQAVGEKMVDDFVRRWQQVNPPISASTTPMSVETAQILLRGHGLYRGSIDGQLGPGTRAALQQFQRQRGLTATGILDDSTALALTRSQSGP